MCFDIAHAGECLALHWQNTSRIFNQSASLYLKWGAILAINAAAGIYWLFIEPSYLTYPQNPMPILNPGKVVHLGETVKVQMMRCNSDDIPHMYSVARNLKADGIRYMLEPSSRMIDPDCGTEIREMELPANAMPASGAYMYGFSETSGTLKTHQVRWQTEYFTILPAASSVSP